MGGRNIGNAYFGAEGGVGFADLDVIAVGPAVREVSKEFDLYWNSPSAYPAASFVGTPGPDAAADLEATFAATRADPECVAYLEAVRTTPLVSDLLDRRLAFEWTTAQLVHDDPAKTLDTTGRTDVLLFPDLVQTIGRPQKSLDLVSPYFVPGDEGTAALVALARKGVKVRILTNSLAASDEKSVHAGYAKRRQDLLRAGVRLYELKPTAAKRIARKQSQVRVELIRGLARKDIRRGPQPHLRRLVQFRPAFGAAEHRDGPRDRESDARAEAGRNFRRRGADDFVRGPAGAGRPHLEWIERTPPARSATTPIRARAGSCAGKSTSCRFSRSNGCFSVSYVVAQAATA